MKKKLISLLLVLALVFSNATFAFAADGDYLTEEPKVKISKEMSGKTALTHIGDDNSIFLDLRAAEDYAAGHIKGTISAPVCLSASEGYKVPVANKEAFVAQMKELKVVENNTKIYLHCYMGTFCVNYAADWLLNDVGVKNSQLVRVLKGTFGDKNLAAASNFTYLDSALAAAEAGTGLILDLRATDVYYADGYLSGSLHQPVFGANGVTTGKDDLAKEFTAFVKANKALLTSKNVYLLCNSGASGAAAATKLLNAAGIKGNVFTIEGGAKELKAKHPELLVKQNTKTADETVAVSGTSTLPSDKNAKVVILDVRTVENYNIGHVKGALSAPVFTSAGVTNGYDETAQAFLATVEANKEKIADNDIYIVCNSGARGAQAATKLLMQAGYSNAKIFTVTGGAKELAKWQTFVSPAQAASVVGNEEYVIIDVRADEKYAAGHFNKSVHLPLYGANGLTTGSDELAEAFNKYLADNKEALEAKKIYILCNSGESIAREASQLLTAAGFTNYFTIDGGAGALAGKLNYASLDYALAQAEAKTGLILDVRAADTYYADGYLDGALHQPLFDANGVTTGTDALADSFAAYVEANKELLASKNVYILCNSGARGAEAATTLLADAGLTNNVFTIEGGAKGLKADHPELLVKQNTKTAEETIAVSGTSTVPSDKNAKVVILDVRTVENYDVGHVKGALSAPVFTSKGVTNGYDKTAQAFLATVEANKDKIADNDIYIVCNSGARGAQAATKLLMQAGYSNDKIFTVTGGAQALAPWQTFVSPAQAASVVKKTKSYVILDVRADAKVAEGTLSGAVLLPLYGENGLTNGSDELAESFNKYLADNKKTLSKKKIYILCNSGESIAREASKLLEAAGFTNYFTIDGGAAALADKLVKPTAPSKMTLSDSTYTFNGKEKKPSVTVKDKKGNKISSKYYTVEYADNVNAGTGTVTVTFKSKYGSYAPMTKTIKISKAKSSSIKLAETSFAYTGEEIVPQFKTSAGIILAETDYTIVEVKNATDVGKATIKVKFQGNVGSATKTYTYKIVPEGTEITSITPGAKSFTVNWDEQTTETTGYQVRYSRYSSFKKSSSKSVSLENTSKEITGLTKNKTYYVKVRTYKKIKDTKYYSAWSDVVKVKTGVSVPKASLKTLKSALNNENAVVLDARTQDAYAGWSTGSNKIGGHIDGASGFSAAWLTCAYNDNANNDNRTREERLAIAMEDKGITADTKVIVYDENGKDAVAVAEYLVEKGVKDVQTFDLANWDGDLVKYENYQTILPPSVVKKLIDGKKVKEVGEVKDLKILEFSWGTEEQSGYLAGHVPTAIHINSDDVDDENYIYILDNDEILIETMKNAGVTVDSTVVVTGAGLFSCHLATILKYLGVEDVYIMSGGASGWTDAGYKAEKKSNKPVPVEDFGTDTPLNPDYIDSVEEVTALLADPNAQVVDTRAYKEYVGDFSGYGYVYSAGRPEGAIFGQEDGSAQGANCNGSSMMYYENIDGTMRDASEILEMWENSGVDTSKHLSFYCGGGYRAAAVMWYAQAMGLEDTSLYNDGWAGWIVNRKDAVKGTYESPQAAEYDARDPELVK